MERGKGDKRKNADGGSDDDAPPNDVQRLGETTEDRAARRAREARLREMQLADLGVDRASAITGADTKKNTHWVDVKALERTRAANTPGTKEYKEAQANKDHLNAWQRVHIILKDDGTHDGKYDINDGQSHREEMRRRLEQNGMVPRSKQHQDHSRGGVRGGRISSSGRGGGVIGTRGRGNAVASSSRSTPSQSLNTSTHPRDNHMNNPRLRGRGAPLLTIVEETTSRRTQPRQPAQATRTFPTNLEVPCQRQALAYNLGGESGSRDAFRAAMNRHAVVTSVSSPAIQSATQSDVLPTPNQRALPSSASTSGQPAVTTFHQSIEPPDTLFGAEIDMAPIGTRVPTPPPPQTVSIRSSSAESYLTDLQGLDLSPSLPQGASALSVTDQQASPRVGNQSGEAQVSPNDREVRPAKKEDSAVKQDISVSLEKSESRHQTSSSSDPSGHEQSPVQVTAQRILAQLLASPDVQSSPDLARNIAQLQTVLGLLQPSRSEETRSNAQSQRPTVKLPKSEKTEAVTLNRGNLNTDSAQANPTGMSPATRVPPSSPTRPGFAGRLQSMQRTLTGIDASLDDIPPIRGDLLDSEYSNPFFAGRLTIKRPTHSTHGRGHIGDHLLPSGPQQTDQQRTRNGSLSSSATILSSQATIRPHEQIVIGDRRSSQSFVSPTRRINAERASVDRLHANFNGQRDENALSSQPDLHLKDSREKCTANADSNLKSSQAKGLSVSELTGQFAKKPSFQPKTEVQDHSTHTQPAIEQPPVARRISGVPLEDIPYPFATRSVGPRAQNNGWLSLTSAPTPSVTATAPVGTLATATTSRSSASSSARVSETANYPDNAITRQYAQAARSSPTNAPTQDSAQETPAPTQRQSTLSPQAATLVGPQTLRSTASTIPAARTVFGGNMTAPRWGDTPAPSVPEASARGQQALTVATNAPGQAIGGNMTASRWGDTPAPTVPQTSARGLQASTAATNALGIAFGGNMNASRWNDDSQSTISQAPVQAEEASAPATNAFGRGVLGTTWSTINDVEIIRTAPQPLPSSSGTRTQTVGGGVAASRWNPITANRDATHALQEDTGGRARGNALPIRAPREIVTDPGIGDTTELFLNYHRPYTHVVPAFLRRDGPIPDPGAAVRRQYGVQFMTLADYAGQENQPLRRSSTKSHSGSDVSPSRQETVRGRRL